MKKLQDDWIVLKHNGNVLMLHIVDSKAEELYIENEKDASKLGNMYIAKVSKVVKNIDAAFLEIENKEMCYYSLKDNPNPFYTCIKKSEKLVAGDELIVQLSKERVKTKDPVVSSNLNFPGRYVVLVHGSSHIGISGKINSKDKARLRELITPFAGENYGFVVRTNAQSASEEEIISEAKDLIAQYEHVLELGKHRKTFTCIKASNPVYCKKLRDIRFSDTTRIRTDEDALFEEMHAFLSENMPDKVSCLEKYEDSLLPLGKLYSVQRTLEDALKARVWLKSGGYLIIQPTEALTVIDVNTGKYDGKKKKEDTFLKINMEAAEEIARQIKLRNLSGMILVDFINMDNKEDDEKLLSLFRERLRQDPIKTTLVDMTGLGLVEITRKKTNMPLYEQIGMSCPVCHGNGYIYGLNQKEEDVIG